MTINRNIGLLLFVLATFNLCCQSMLRAKPIQPGAASLMQYLPLLSEKKVGLIVNQSSLVNGTHLIDTLIARGIDVHKLLVPEHGFKGTHDAGEKVGDGKSQKHRLEIVSLYGSNKKPDKKSLSGLDILVFDLQDVGLRFFTYISTMHYAMEACAENQLPFIVLDRPNPNGRFIDGPVLEPEFKSFVGMHEIPVLHGMTVGELALMINTEGWLANGVKVDLTVIPCKNYSHSMQYSLPVRPSPNLPNDQSILLYPSLCFFEGTVVSVGRGTPFPFQVAGNPSLKEIGNFEFIPAPGPGAKHPKLNGKTCYGWDLRNVKAEEIPTGLELKWMLQAYKNYHGDQPFFLENNFINKLAGTDQLKVQIESGQTEEAIRKSWQPGIEAFKKLRRTYLLYPD